jgi:hypothetical protein
MTDYEVAQMKPPGSDVTISNISKQQSNTSRRIKQTDETPRINYETLNTIYNKKYTSTGEHQQTTTKSFKPIINVSSQSKYKSDLNYSRSESYDQNYKNKFLHQTPPPRFLSKMSNISPALSEHPKYISDQLTNNISSRVDNYIYNGNSNKVKYSTSTSVTPSINHVDLDSKFKTSSYFKPSTTSDTASPLEKNTNTILRSRQLHLGKAKIDLESPQQCKIKPKQKSFFS